MSNDDADLEKPPAAVDLAEVMSEIRACLPAGGDWCTLDKAQALAALVLGLRPRVVCEIGVWLGGSLIPMGIALRAVGRMEAARGQAVVDRRLVAIDAWSADASAAGQGAADLAWWRAQDHDAILTAFRARLDQHGLARLCEVVRASSEIADVPGEIDLLHVDGNHAQQAVADVRRFGPAVNGGGILVLDDVSWSGGHVRRALDAARELGFRDRYPLGTGVVLQRVAPSR